MEPGRGIDHLGVVDCFGVDPAGFDPGLQMYQIGSICRLEAILQ